jgi:G3E family GTPase
MLCTNTQGPVASCFWLDEALNSALRLDAIVTVVDAKNITHQLSSTDGGEAAQQVAFADRILLNKTDLVSTAATEALLLQLRAMNSACEAVCTQRCKVDLDWILNVDCFRVDKHLATVEAMNTTNSSSDNSCELECCHEHGAAGDHNHQHCTTTTATTDATAQHHRQHKQTSGHTLGVTTCSVTVAKPVDVPLLERWIGEQLWEQSDSSTTAAATATDDAATSSSDADATGSSTDVAASAAVNSDSERKPAAAAAAAVATKVVIYRIKGIVCAHNSSVKHVLQGVHDLFDVSATAAVWGDTEHRVTKIVFIGKGLDQQALQAGLETCVVLSDSSQ